MQCRSMPMCECAVWRFFVSSSANMNVNHRMIAQFVIGQNALGDDTGVDGAINITCSCIQMTLCGCASVDADRGHAAAILYGGRTYYVASRAQTHLYRKQLAISHVAIKSFDSINNIWNGNGVENSNRGQCARRHHRLRRTRTNDVVGITRKIKA